MSTTLERTTFSTSRLLEFFTQKELQAQMGHSLEWWPVALVKELVDNALDACEIAEVSPEIEITVSDDWVSVRDNGPGLPAEIIEKSLDYMMRVSDKTYYISPTRGQLGSALKCVWAAPYVANGREHGLVEVSTGGVTHWIRVSLDRIKQCPNLQHRQIDYSLVKNGTFVKIHWPGVAGSLDRAKINDLYKDRDTQPGPMDAVELLWRFAAFNPHVSFVYRSGDRELRIPATNPEWKKWQPNAPTSPHWYTEEHLRGLIAAYIGEGEGQKTVRAFVSEFAGLRGTRKQKAVTEAAGLSGKVLADMVTDGDINTGLVRRLLTAMRLESKVVKPFRLGVLGEAHLTDWLQRAYRVEPESVRYKKTYGMEGDLPFVLEMVFGIFDEEHDHCVRSVITGLNWAPALKIPVPQLRSLLGEMRIDSLDPVVVVMHLAQPRLEFTDRGKSTIGI